MSESLKLSELVRSCRSYRKFKGSVAIPRETLVGFIENARLSASTVNLQPLKYYISNSKESNDILRKNSKWAGLLKDYPGPTGDENPSAYIVILLDSETVPNPEHFMKDVGIAAQTIMLSAVEAGFGGCMIGSFVPDKLKAELELPEQLTPALVLALGVPDEEIILEDMPEGEPASHSTAYYRDDAFIHHVPKRALSDIIVN